MARRLMAFCLVLGLAVPAVTSGQTQEAVLEAIPFEQRLDAQVPLDLVFRDAEGQKVTLSDYFGEKPVVLSLVYYECPMLCTLVLNGMVTGFKDIPYTVGRDFEVVTVSFDHEETHVLAAAKKTAYVADYGRPGAAEGWHFLVGDKTSVDALCDAVGFGYQYDPNTDEYGHRSGIYLLTPKGRVSRVFPGIEYAPRDLRLGLVEASDNRIGTVVDKLALLCYHYDPKEGAYSFFVMNIVRIGCFLTVGALAAALFVFIRRERRKLAQTKAVAS
jgi:protein SCO1/2